MHEEMHIAAWITLTAGCLFYALSMIEGLEFLFVIAMGCVGSGFSFLGVAYSALKKHAQQ